MLMTPGESLAPWVSLIEQESYLPYIKNVIKEIYMYIYTYKPYLYIIYINLKIYIIYINHIY